MITRWQVLLFGLGLPVMTWADPFWEQHAEGWHWYRDPLLEQASEPAEPQDNRDPTQQMKAIQRELKRSLDRAVLSPTADNIRHYIEWQNRVAQQASLFSARWRATLLENPSLDYSLTHPTNQIGKQVYGDRAMAEKKDALYAIAKMYGLFFFFRSTCGYCHRLAPILKEIATHYGFSILAISIDGGTLPEFPNAKRDHGWASKLSITTVPALLAVDPKTKQLIPIAYGLLSEEELIEHITALAPLLSRDPP